ncbi:MAG: glycosyltransferase, exosortase A system-associated [Betaproteobacteria bacterium]|nr:glycosyltransferase, exosortase A system-associated [Betaproteobacteria bacterium]
MRVLHVLDHSAPLHSGYAFRTLAILRESQALGWETVQMTSPKQGGSVEVREETVDGWLFHRTPPVRGLVSDLPAMGELELMGELAHRIETLVRRYSPHVVHVHSPVLNAIPALRVGRRTGVPVVYEIRALWEDAAVDHGTTREGSLRYRLSRALETYAAKRAHHVVTICEGLREELVARGVRPDRITVVPNGVDVDRFNTTPTRDATLARELGLEGSTVLGFVGSFYGYEGLESLVRALPRILVARPDVRLLLVGGGFQDDSLRAQVLALGLGDKVVFTGRVPHSEVHRYYDLIDVLVYPRLPMRLTDLVTPLKPLEAMAQGRLVVASDVGGHRELMKDGETAVLFKAGDVEDLAAKVLDLLASPERWPQLRAAARRYVETQRTWNHCVARYDEVYGRLVALERMSA